MEGDKNFWNILFLFFSVSVFDWYFATEDTENTENSMIFNYGFAGILGKFVDDPFDLAQDRFLVVFIVFCWKLVDFH